MDDETGKCGADNLQFWVLVVHCRFDISVAHCLPDGGQVPGSHENSSAVVMSRTVEDQFYGKTVPACVPGETDCRSTSDARMRNRLDGNTQPSCLSKLPYLPSVLARSLRSMG